MRKNKWLLPKILTFFALIAINISCDKELYDDAISSSKKASIREVKFDELLKEQKFKNLFTTVSDNHLQRNSSARSAFENQYGFTIVNTSVKVIETDSLTSYTMLIERDENTNETFFENLVIQEDIFNNQKAAIFKYSPTLITPTYHNSFLFQGSIQKQNINNFSGFNRNSYENTTQSECYADVLMCNESWSGGSLGSEHTATGACRNINFLFVKRVRVICAGDSGGGGGGDFWDGSGSGDNGSGFGDTGGGGGDGPNEFPSDENNEIVTSPILTIDNPRPLTNPCNRVKNITNNTPNLKSKITNFKTPQVLNLNYEKGFNFVDNAQNQTQLVQNDGNANSTSIPVITLVDGSMTGVLHSHFYRPDMLPTFTFEDLMTFNSIYQYRKYNQKSLDKLTLMVVTRAGVFAMMIENESMFDTNGHNLWTDQNAQLRKIFYGDLETKKNITDEDVIIQVTKGLTNYGIGLYQANSDLSNWSKITVDANNNKVSTPCN